MRAHETSSSCAMQYMRWGCRRGLQVILLTTTRLIIDNPLYTKAERAEEINKEFRHASAIHVPAMQSRDSPSQSVKERTLPYQARVIGAISSTPAAPRRWEVEKRNASPDNMPVVMYFKAQTAHRTETSLMHNESEEMAGTMPAIGAEQDERVEEAGSSTKGRGKRRSDEAQEEGQPGQRRCSREDDSAPAHDETAELSKQTLDGDYNLDHIPIPTTHKAVLQERRGCRPPPKATEKEWQRRTVKRQAIIACVKASDEYLDYVTRIVTPELVVAAPLTPKATDRAISKRQWEYDVRQWREALREFGQEEVDNSHNLPEPQNEAKNKAEEGVPIPHHPDCQCSECMWKYCEDREAQDRCQAYEQALRNTAAAARAAAAVRAAAASDVAEPAFLKQISEGRRSGRRRHDGSKSKNRRAEGAQVAAALDDDESRRAEGAQVAAALDDELIGWMRRHVP